MVSKALNNDDDGSPLPRQHPQESDYSALPPPPTAQEMLQCQFSSWYDTFRSLQPVPPQQSRRRTNVTIKSIVLPLPPEFLDYLLSDGLRLPKGATRVSSFVPNETTRDEADVWSSDDEREAELANDKHDDDDDNDNDNDASSEKSLKQFYFPQLNQQIEDSIHALGGSVMPKLNWSSPKDATWVNNGTLQCRTAGDVYLLLKSSDFVLHDVVHALDDVQPSNSHETSHRDLKYELVLRKWCNLHPSMEFRCFVYNRTLIAISQRSHTQHFAHLVRDRVTIESHLVEFFKGVVRERFPLAHYCLDVYLDKKDCVWLLDFNVWGRQTDTLLYTWEELVERSTNESSCRRRRRHPSSEADQDTSMPLAAAPMDNLLRVVETELEIHQDPLASYRAPIDTIDLASSKNFDEFMAMCQRPSERNDE